MDRLNERALKQLFRGARTHNAGAGTEFFAGTTVKSNFPCNLGIGDPAGPFDRSPRPGFDDIAEIL